MRENPTDFAREVGLDGARPKQPAINGKLVVKIHYTPPVFIISRWREQAFCGTHGTPCENVRQLQVFLNPRIGGLKPLEMSERKINGNAIGNLCRSAVTRCELQYFRLRLNQWWDFADNVCMDGIDLSADNPKHDDIFSDFIYRTISPVTP